MGAKCKGTEGQIVTGASVHDCVVGGGVEAVMQEVGSAVGQQRVSLHLAKADAAAKLAPFYRLVRQRVHRARRPHLYVQRVLFC